MNNVWMLATEQQMQRKYHLPVELVADKRNRLWGEIAQLNGVTEPPLPFIADIRTDLPLQFTRLVAKTINEESQWGGDRFNHLKTLGQCSLKLYPKEIPATIEVMTEIANSLPEQNKRKVFEPLVDEAELKSLGMRPSYQESIRDAVYTLTPDRDLPEHKQDYAIIRFNIFETCMYFSMGYFNPGDLEKKQYMHPFFYILNPGLYLTRNGILELIELFKENAHPLIQK